MTGIPGRARDVFGPYDLTPLLNQRADDRAEPAAPVVMELMRLSHYDPQVFFDHDQIVLNNAHPR